MIGYIRKNNILLNLAIIIFIILNLFPIFWMISSSFKTSSEITTLPPKFFVKPKIINYIAIFKERPFFHYTINSVTIAGSVALLCILLGVPAAYALSKFEFPGRKIFLISIISSRLFPPISLLVPFTILFTKLQLVDTRLGLIVASLFLNLPFVVWLLIGFFDSIPHELEEAARIDGCDRIDVFFKIIIPLVKTGMASGAILSFIMTWNEFMFALAFTRMNAKTLPIGLYDFFADDFVVWNKVMAASTYSVIPAIIFILFFQNYLVKGLISGSVKG